MSEVPLADHARQGLVGVRPSLDPHAAILDAAEKEILLTVKEYAGLFKVTPRGVQYALREGRFPYPVVRPLGGHALIRVPASLVAKLKAA